MQVSGGVQVMVVHPRADVRLLCADFNTVGFREVESARYSTCSGSVNFW